MAISASSSFFTSSNLPLHSHQQSRSISTSVSFGRVRISASYATAETTATEAIRSSRNGSQPSLYEVLGVRIGADIGDVKAAYRRLARVLHPDVGSRHSSADEFMKVHSAYTTLSDPAKRAEYDRSMVLMRAAGSCRSRRWETDQCW
ncbi:hypothetical protein LXL04_015096 [Taraxacum kok-saghyz]